jgi:hypothetical protein
VGAEGLHDGGLAGVGSVQDLVVGVVDVFE